jgi:hypothetical protein
MKKTSVARATLPHFAAGIIVIIVAGTTPSVDTIMARCGFRGDNRQPVIDRYGLLHLRMTTDILRVAIGLMTVLSGFEIIYAAVEGSVLVAALLAVVHWALRWLAHIFACIQSKGIEAA